MFFQLNKQATSFIRNTKVSRCFENWLSISSFSFHTICPTLKYRGRYYLKIQIRLHKDFPSSILWWIWCKIVFNYWPWINLNHPSTSVSSSPKWPAFYPFNLADVWTLKLTTSSDCACKTSLSSQNRREVWKSGGG